MSNAAGSSSPYDLVVIGGGSGGVRAARLTGQLGKRVCIIEEKDLGGTCVHRGCVPKKFLVYASRFAGEFTDAAAYGWNVKTEGFEWKRLIENKDRELDRLGGLYERGLTGAGVEIVRGRAVFDSPTTVRVGQRSIEGARFLIAVGGRPDVVEIEGAGLGITSDDVFHLEALPKSIVIAGGGYIGVELACLFNLLGTETHLVHRGPRVLRTFDEECVEFLQERMRTDGVHLHLGQTIDRLTKGPEGITAHLENGTQLTGEAQLAATGRVPNTQGLGLDAAGVDVADDGSVIVDENYRTSAAHIFALGDVIRRLELTPVAIAEAISFVRREFEETERALDYTNVPTAVFSTPTFATVGMTEEQAWQRGHRVVAFCSNFRPMKQSLSQRNTRAFMKLVVCEETDELLGAHVVGPHAGEILQSMAVAIRCGAKKADLDGTIGIHPTAAEELVQMRSPTRTPDHARRPHIEQRS
ncbi:MAG: glutathione-disulfide reductase [Myxococcota bacterium]